ncbi:hypothetical protein DYQ86_12550 [Acidobacteria bacterium AB60]|nr:hypothetical protein DYQ86_12550 [Acidobacteria bacterium AB60]
MTSTTTRFAKSSIAALLALLLALPVAQASPLQQQQPAPAPDAPTPQLADPASRSTMQPQQNQNPVGTAAAPVAKPTGVAASRPAGAVIAPAKQKRRKAILIRVGIIVGAGVAVGTVAALSRGSSSRP